MLGHAHAVQASTPAFLVLDQVKEKGSRAKIVRQEIT
jgi:hypothetical protein